MDTNRIADFFAASSDAGATTPLERKQEMLRHYTRMVANGQSFGLFCFGSGGNGKSTVITEELLAREIQPVILNSHLTALGLFQVLWTYRSNRILLIEDCEAALSSPPILGLLRSALCGVGDERRVTYTTSVQFDLPPSFVFESRIIICANSVPKSEAFKALTTRCLVFHLDPTNEEILEQFHIVAARGFQDLSPEVCRSVVEFISNNANRRLCMRLLTPIFRTVQYARHVGVPWEPLVVNQLQELVPTPTVAAPLNARDQDFRHLEEAMQRYPQSVQDQLRHFLERSGRSRATFFRRKSEWEKRQG